MTCDTAGFDDLLARLSAGAVDYFGDGGAAIRPVARIERPYSALLRLRVEAGGDTSHAFLKVFKPSGTDAGELAQLRRYVEREYRSTRRLHDVLRERPGLTALRPIAVFPDQLALVTEEVQGETFELVAKRARHGAAPANDAVRAAERVGAWIRTYQEVTEVKGRLSLPERRKYLNARLDRLAGDILTPAECTAVLGRFDAIAACIDAADLDLVGIHADLSPSNILVTVDGGVTILDFAMAKTGARYHDVAHLFLHLERLRKRSWRSASRVEALKSALLRGIDPALRPSHPLFALMLLQHVVCDIAQQAQRNVGALRPVYRALLRRRWASGLATVAAARST